ncbi:MAG: hypothetical protein JXR83_02065 [Deltaproteobacteria bacterium]|nr:hypothetical protein [Deltaproteobacteria bacterium]
MSRCPLPSKIICGVGILAHLFLAFKAGLSLGGLMCLASALPYGVFLGTCKSIKNRWAATFGALAIMIPDLLLCVSAGDCVGPATALVYVFACIPLITVCWPAGMIAGWIFSKTLLPLGRQFLTESARRGIEVVFYCAIGIAVGAGVYHRELILPSIQASEDVREEIGEERVVLGQNRFSKAPRSEIRGRIEYDVFDSRGGPEIADIWDCPVNTKVRLRDPMTLALKRVVKARYRERGPMRVVSLHRDGQLNLLFAHSSSPQVKLLDLDGNVLWTFGSEGSSPLHTTLAADLEGDGETEFYATADSGIYRLDASGNVVWKTRDRGGRYLVIIPAHADSPALVVSDTPDDRISMWGADGLLVRRIRPEREAYQLQAVRWGSAYRLAVGQRSHRASRFFLMDLDGKVVFEQRIGKHFEVAQILSARLQTPGRHCLVVQGLPFAYDSPWELNIFSSDGQLVYKELREHYDLYVIPDEQNDLDRLFADQPIVEYQAR